MGNNDHNESYETVAGDGRPAQDGFAALEAMNWEPPPTADGTHERDERDRAQPSDAPQESFPWSAGPTEYPAPPPPPYAQQQPPPAPYAPPIYGYDPPSPSGPQPPPVPPAPPEAYGGSFNDLGSYYYEYYQPPAASADDPPPPPDAGNSPAPGPTPGAPDEVPPQEPGRQEAWAPPQSPAPPYGQSSPSEPSYEPPSYEPPSYEAPSYEPPSYEPPSYEAPSYEAASYEPPSYEQSSYEPSSYEAPSYELSSYEPPSYGRNLHDQQGWDAGAPDAYADPRGYDDETRQHWSPEFGGPPQEHYGPHPSPHQDSSAYAYEEPPLLPFEPVPTPPTDPVAGPPPPSPAPNPAPGSPPTSPAWPAIGTPTSPAMGAPPGQPGQPQPQPQPQQPYYPPPMPYPQPGVAQPGQAPPWQQPPGPPVPPPQTAESLRPETLLRGRKQPPSHGWRRAVYKASIGAVHLGESSAELRRQELVHRARTPVVDGHHRVAVMSLKGGVGKTTTTVGLGATLAWLRGDRVIAVDANPDRGTLSDKVRLETAATVRDLLAERAHIQRYADIRAFTSQSPSRLEVLASDRDPAASEAFSEEDYRAVATVLEQHYSICLTDCGTGLLHSAMSGVLGLADQIVLVSSPSVDGARSASATLDWLGAHEHSDLVRGAVVVLSTVRPKSKSTVDINRLEQHFANRCRAVVRVPYDPHLEEGAEVDLDRLRPDTRDAYLKLAAAVGDGFALSGA